MRPRGGIDGAIEGETAVNEPKKGKRLMGCTEENGVMDNNIVLFFLYIVTQFNILSQRTHSHAHAKVMTHSLLSPMELETHTSWDPVDRYNDL